MLRWSLSYTKTTDKRMKRHQHKYIGIIIIKLYKKMTNIFQDYNQKKKYFKNAWEQQSVDLLLLLPSIPVYVSLKNYAKTTIVKIFFFFVFVELWTEWNSQKKWNDEAYTVLLPFICYTTEMLQFRECRCTFITMKEWMLIHKRFAWHNW